MINFQYKIIYPYLLMYLENTKSYSLFHILPESLSIYFYLPLINYITSYNLIYFLFFGDYYNYKYYYYYNYIQYNTIQNSLSLKERDLFNILIILI
jgi:hypothetical protein